jgi:high-affinity iron transporter
MSVRRHLASFVFCFSALGLPAAAFAQTADQGQSLRQVAGILDYIGGDYRGAVDASGRVLDQAEYDEQLSLEADADALAAQAGIAGDAPLRQSLAALRRDLQAKAPPGAIADLCRRARALLVEQHGLVLGPSSTPSREQGARLYVSQACHTCHGEHGGADTEIARTLNPPPANFLDAERVASVSPHRAFYAISFGVAGTGMTAYAHLSEADRWSLAFHVLALRHSRRDLEAGRSALERSGAALPTTAAGLAALGEDEIIAKLAAAGVASAERLDALAYLRAGAPFEQRTARSSSLLLARSELRAGVDAYRDGDSAGARRHFVAAYLDGFEPYEAGLAARDSALVRRIEQAMLMLRARAGDGANRDEVERLAADVEALLTTAERGRGDGTTALLGAFTIALREGLEAALLVTALLGLVRRRGAPELARYVHGGWLLAVLGGLITWWGVGELLSGLQRELAEGIAALLAAVVLIGVTHWLFGQLTARRFMGFVAERMATVGGGRGAALGVLGLSFIAAYREAFELVLFYKALLLEAGAHANRVWLGAALGIAALLVVAFVLKRIGQRLQPRPFMLMSGVLLALLAFTLAGKGVRALQEAAVLGITILPLPELPWLGVYATVEGLVTQALVLLVLLASALWPLLSARAGDQPQPAQ